jgi:DNA-binding transcriptional MocR family regulator
MTLWAPALPSHPDLKYQALVDAIQRDIDAGVLPPGTRLPAQRDLAGSLGVAIGTVTRAYSLAEERGLVSCEVGRGTFVRRREPSESVREEGEDPSLLDLAKGRFARDTKHPTLGKAIESLARRRDLDAMVDHYHPAIGMERHRVAGAAWIRRIGLDVDPARVIITNGAQHGAATVLAAIAEPGSTVLTEEITYSGIKAVATLQHLQLRGLPLDRHGLRPDAFEAACRDGNPRILICMPTLQNPTGRTMPLERRREIAAIAQAHGVAILEDDVNGFLPREPLPPLATLAPANTYYITGTSKSLAPGLRVGYLVAPAHRVERIAATIRATTWFTAPLMAELMTDWIRSGVADEVVEWKRLEIEARYAMAATLLGPWLQPDGPVSFHCWLPLPDPWRTETFVAQARARGVLVTSAEEFTIGRESAPHAVRVCLGSTLSREQLDEGLKRLAELLAQKPEPSLTVY